ncbi:ATP-dependent zinc metalloprotease FtsH [Neoehrlichia mikurensis]|uniref:ATP-dependent zinc metalloprotease FtsH n=1 Tax=Neoehrlichia mikurensis TaxID=89586 RepID=A0A9Q9C1I9_9RICK|nr:ATP-dependent zinc metalloprotease FtsH [Neoehrlichia mikurensis]QXK91613.1 ATP-dependent zinc metalloprotease FtsH [Neoehrlichia mikurensis]QXK92824.1 ATP-dependent metallopeptidase FtsH/Yme1/Tma family protein [Neoehrlichia mikurensis]QXK93304.1 ATP-dependent zinc metalloprotease FtsH [Neoehrlichia mikurensis]UTO55754.1 ATP-dependent zinc metalloprotease FtsH [Neoehrlichia mikurensis]UTO56671.1 ATP-dependent zinc metalloprotease FtsH [Neoehrlichia mikurensis]
MRKITEGLVIWSAIIIIITVLYIQFNNKIIGNSSIKLPFSEFLNKLDNNEVESAVITDRNIEGILRNGSKFRTHGVIYDNLIKSLHAHQVTFSFAADETFLGIVGNIFISWFPMFLLIIIWFIFLKQMQAGGTRTMSFSKSRARLMTENRNKVTFNDVAGIDEAKEELVEIVEFLKHRQKFQKLGGRIPKGCLLIGSPGTGKTLLARAIAGEANVPFFSISGSDFVEMFVGVGASRVRDMFEQGKKNAPCIIFIDEIDAVGRHRGIGLGGGNDEREQTLNQLLVEMDGFESNEGVIIIAATNRPDVLDNALLRPGRFDRQVTIPIPDISGREKIINVHIKKIPIAPDVNIKVIARGTPGFSGADLSNLVNEAALVAARLNKKIVTMNDFEYARDKVMMGAERKSMIMTDEEKKLTAYHEAGHAVIAFYTPASDPIHKATIIPRGRSLGLVMRLPESDRVSHTREKMIADLTVAMGGRAAEELIFGYNKVTSGASSDIKQATDLARSMVMKWGMSDKVGPLYHSEEKNEIISNDLANLIDNEVKLIVSSALERAKNIINEHLDALHTIAKNLLEFETLTGNDIKDIIDGKKLIKHNNDNDNPVKSSLANLPHNKG